MKIRTWDTVQVIAWSRKYKWKNAKVLKVFKETWRVLVEWVNIVTRHIKKHGTTPGQIVKMEKSIDISNVMLLCPITQKPTRVWYVMIEEKWKNKKFRYSKIAVKETAKSPKDCIIK